MSLESEEELLDGRSHEERKGGLIGAKRVFLGNPLQYPQVVWEILERGMLQLPLLSVVFYFVEIVDEKLVRALEEEEPVGLLPGFDVLEDLRPIDLLEEGDVFFLEQIFLLELAFLK